ncbi:MAG: hypothetical protein QOI05_828 [Bradyrhizobium sp.]|nr:hypothetical protein [Bradyrhizobium sp.]
MRMLEFVSTHATRRMRPPNSGIARNLRSTVGSFGSASVQSGSRAVSSIHLGSICRPRNLIVACGVKTRGFGIEGLCNYRDYDPQLSTFNAAMNAPCRIVQDQSDGSRIASSQSSMASFSGCCAISLACRRISATTLGSRRSGTRNCTGGNSCAGDRSRREITRCCRVRGFGLLRIVAMDKTYHVLEEILRLP